MLRLPMNQPDPKTVKRLLAEREAQGFKRFSKELKIKIVRILMADTDKTPDKK